MKLKREQLKYSEHTTQQSLQACMQYGRLKTIIISTLVDEAKTYVTNKNVQKLPCDTACKFAYGKVYLLNKD